MNIDLDTKETSYFIDAICNHCKRVNDLFTCGRNKSFKGNVLIKFILLFTLCAAVKKK